MTVDPELTVGPAQDVAHHAEQHLLADVRRLTGVTIHISPTGAHTGEPLAAAANASHGCPGH